ncbi:MAG: hypothetical protein AB7S26_15435 [Sandaracinaceae bacterium]
MRRSIVFALSLSVSSALAGCTCAVDPDHYLTRRDAGPDARVLRDGEVPDAALPDGGDAGRPTDPLPPVASGVGFSDYRPAVGDALSAIVGPSFDPNGDAVQTLFAWSKNGMPITGATAASITLDAARFAVGDEVTLEVTFSDGSLTTTRAVGPAVLIDDTVRPRWELLLPPRGRQGGGGSLAFDTQRQRMLWRASTRETDLGLFEYQLPRGSEMGRWVRMQGTQGAAPNAFGNLILSDPARDRILVYGGRIPVTSGDDMRVNTLWTLSLAGPQGSEAWGEVSTSGAPTPRDAIIAVPVHLAEDEEAFVFYGGVTGSEMTTQVVENDLFVLHVEDNDRWELTDASRPGAGAALPTMFEDRANHLLYLAGGAELSASGINGLTEVFVLDLHDISAGFTPASWSLPAGRFGAAAVVNGRTVYLVGGVSSLGAMGPVIETDTLRVDLDTGTIDALVADPPPAPTIQPVSRAPFDPNPILISRGFDELNPRFDTFDVGAELTRPITGHLVDMPPPMHQGVAADREGVPGVVLYGGRTGIDEPPTGVADAWAYDGMRFSILPLAGNPPGARWGFSFDASSAFDSYEVFVVGGRADAATGLGTLASMEPYRARWADGQWERYDFNPGAGANPPPHEGHAVFRGQCRGNAGELGNVVAFAGGETLGGIDSHTYVLQCTVQDRTQWTDCFWRDAALMNAGRATVWSAAVQLSDPMVPDDYEHTFLIGGHDATGTPTNRVQYLRACFPYTGTPDSWTLVTAPAAPAVYGHTVTAIPAPSATMAGRRVIPEAYLLFGGSDDFGYSVSPDVFRVTWDGNRVMPTATFAMVDADGPERPVGRTFHSTAYDYVERRLLVYGGIQDGDVLDDLWALILP